MATLLDRDRLAVLVETGLLDRPSTLALDRYASIAKTALDVPVALVSLVDDHRQFFSSQAGLGEPLATGRETPLSHSFCQHVVIDERPLVVTDARIDPRVATNLAVRDLSVIAYAGMPIRTSDGYVLGSFCAIDTKPKVWSDRDLSVLRELALAVGAEIDTQRRAVRAEKSEQKLAELIGTLETSQHQVAHNARQTTHDLRTPLQTIALGLDSLRMQHEEWGRPEAARLLAMLRRSTDHAVELVNALHDMGNLPGLAERVNLSELVSVACADLQLRQQAIRIDVAASDRTDLVVLATASDLRRSVDNLVTNAQRFATSRILVCLGRTGESAQLTVEDDGPGLPRPEDYERAWSVGTRFHEAEGRSGTGLGLASVRATIEWSGGRVFARRSELGGAAFGFALPLAAG